MTALRAIVVNDDGTVLRAPIMVGSDSMLERVIKWTLQLSSRGRDAWRHSLLQRKFELAAQGGRQRIQVSAQAIKRAVRDRLVINAQASRRTAHDRMRATGAKQASARLLGASLLPTRLNLIDGQHRAAAVFDELQHYADRLTLAQVQAAEAALIVVAALAAGLDVAPQLTPFPPTFVPRRWVSVCGTDRLAGPLVPRGPQAPTLSAVRSSGHGAGLGQGALVLAA